MNKELLKAILENLDETCFPIQIDWNNEKLYLKGLDQAITKAIDDMGYKLEPVKIENL